MAILDCYGLKVSTPKLAPPQCILILKPTSQHQWHWRGRPLEGVEGGWITGDQLSHSTEGSGCEQETGIVTH